MKSCYRLYGLAALAIAIAIPNLSHADRRSFVWNYEAKTMQKGEAEIEYYLTGSVSKADGAVDEDLTFEHRAEVEYGVTDNFDVAMYQVFRQVEGEELRYRGYKVRGRYRFGDIGQRFIDPLIYLEVHHNPLSEEVTFEQKIVLAKNINNFIIALNLTTEQEIKYKDNAKEYLFKPSLALGYQIRPWITVALEMEDRALSISPGGFDHNSFHVGPTISLAGQTIWWNVGALVQATTAYDSEPRYQVRTLAGIFF